MVPTVAPSAIPACSILAETNNSSLRTKIRLGAPPKKKARYDRESIKEELRMIKIIVWRKNSSSNISRGDSQSPRIKLSKKKSEEAIVWVILFIWYSGKPYTRSALFHESLILVPSTPFWNNNTLAHCQLHNAVCILEYQNPIFISVRL